MSFANPAHKYGPFRECMIEAPGVDFLVRNDPKAVPSSKLNVGTKRETIRSEKAAIPNQPAQTSGERKDVTLLNKVVRLDKKQCNLSTKIKRSVRVNKSSPWSLPAFLNVLANETKTIKIKKQTPLERNEMLEKAYSTAAMRSFDNNCTDLNNLSESLEELYCLHGTPNENIQSIAVQGFMLSLYGSNGEGVYATSSLSTAAFYSTKRIPSSSPAAAEFDVIVAKALVKPTEKLELGASVTYCVKNSERIIPIMRLTCQDLSSPCNQ